MAEAVTRQGSDLDLLIDTVRGRSEAAKDIDSYAGRRAQLIAQARLASEGRQEHVSQRARALGQALLAR